jgi:hypothetical protein
MTRIWGTADESEETYSVSIGINPPQIISAVVSISKVEFTDDDDHSWAQAHITDWVIDEGGNLGSTGFSDTNPKSYMNKKNKKLSEITVKLKVRNDDGYVKADCPITIFFHS